MLATREGTIVRQRIERIITRRSARVRGVVLQKLNPTDEVAAVTILPVELDSDSAE